MRVGTRVSARARVGQKSQQSTCRIQTGEVMPRGRNDKCEQLDQPNGTELEGPSKDFDATGLEHTGGE